MLCRLLFDTVEPLLSGNLLNSHPYKAASNQSPNDGFLIVSIKQPNPFKQPQSISPRVAI